MASSTFQGCAGTPQSLGPLNMDFPQWSSHSTMEELSLSCQIPTTVSTHTPTTPHCWLGFFFFFQEGLLRDACVLQVSLPGDVTDLEVIGKWGEELVHSFLCHWRDAGGPGRPAHILWCNQSGESGRPFDFRLTFECAGEPSEEVYVEVKSTVKTEKSLVHMSANELDFALKKKQSYHIYRVYNAGDAQNFRLCRLQNLAQHLHTKNISLYLFL